MKIMKEHYEYMKTLMRPIVKDYPRTNEEWKGLSYKRYCWDIWRMAGLATYTCDTLYKYLNDDHIDTALKRIVKELENASMD